MFNWLFNDSDERKASLLSQEMSENGISAIVSYSRRSTFFITYNANNPATTEKIRQFMSEKGLSNYVLRDLND